MLELRLANKTDFDFYYALKCESSSIYWGGHRCKPDYRSLQEFFLSIIDEKLYRKILFLTDKGRKVGYVQIDLEKKCLGLSMGIIENERGKGYGGKIIELAIKKYGLDKEYYCYIREDNYASISSFKKNGFIKDEESYMQKFEIDQKDFKMEKYIRRSASIIAIIPARSGSKGLKDKNIKLLNGKPLMSYSIEAALKSGLFDVIHVSTDSKDYADIASSYGADEPFLRGSDSSGDKASTWDVVKEVLRKYREIGKEFSTVVLLQPTSPMRNEEDIKASYDLFISNNAKSLTSVSEVDHPVQWCFKLDETHLMKEYCSSPFKNVRRQDLEKHYRENGAIYIVAAKDIEEPSFEFYSQNCMAYIMPKERSTDIDTLYDFVCAEAIMRMQTEDKRCVMTNA